MPDRDIDEPIADVIEQHTDAVPDVDEDTDEIDEIEEATRRGGVPLEVDEADAAEQARVISSGEEDYR